MTSPHGWCSNILEATCQNLRFLPPYKACSSLCISSQLKEPSLAHVTIEEAVHHPRPCALLQPTLPLSKPVSYSCYHWLQIQNRVQPSRHIEVLFPAYLCTISTPCHSFSTILQFLKYTLLLIPRCFCLCAITACNDCSLSHMLD